MAFPAYFNAIQAILIASQSVDLLSLFHEFSKMGASNIYS